MGLYVCVYVGVCVVQLCSISFPTSLPSSEAGRSPLRKGFTAVMEWWKPSAPLPYAVVRWCGESQVLRCSKLVHTILLAWLVCRFCPLLLSPPLLAILESWNA